MTVSIATFTFESRQPYRGGGIANNAFNQCLYKRVKAFDIWLGVGLNRFTDTVKLLLNTQIGEGGDTQL